MNLSYKTALFIITIQVLQGLSQQTGIILSPDSLKRKTKTEDEKEGKNPKKSNFKVNLIM